MHLQTGDIEGLIVRKDQPKAKTIRTNNKTNNRIQPDRRRDLWGRRIYSNNSRMLYWQKASHCALL